MKEEVNGGHMSIFKTWIAALALSLVTMTGWSQVLYKNLTANMLVSTGFPSHVNEVIVDKSGKGDYSSITQALEYVDSVHATNATRYVAIHIVVGDYYENPVFKGYTVVYGDARRSRILGNTTITGGPTFFENLDFRTLNGTTPVTFTQIGLNLKCIIGDCYILNDYAQDTINYGVVMTNSPAGTYCQIFSTEIYVCNMSATANAKAICVNMDSGGLELWNLRLKTSSAGGIENEYLAWLTGTAGLQVENSEYQVLHDLNGTLRIDDSAGVEWMDSSVVNNENKGNFLTLSGSHATAINYYGKETGALKVRGDIEISSGPTNDSLTISSDGTNTYQTDILGTTNQYVVSPLGSNNIAVLWQGSYTEYLALPTKTDSTTYIISDDDTVYDTMGIYQGIDTYNVIPSGITTVTIVPDKTVYFVNVNTNTSLHFDMSALNFTNKVATFEVWLAYLDTNSSLTWQDSSSIYWISGTPSFTTVATNYFVMRATSTNSIHANRQYTK